MSGYSWHLCSAGLSVVMLQCWGTHSIPALSGCTVGGNRRARRYQQVSPEAGSFPGGFMTLLQGGQVRQGDKIST